MSSTNPKLFRIGMVELAGETTYLTENSTAYTYVRVVNVDRSALTRTVIENAYQTQDFGEVPPIIGRAEGTITTEHYVHGHKSTVPTDPSDYAHTTPDNAGATGFDMVAGAVFASFGGGMAGGYNGSLDFTGSTTAILKGDDLSSFAAGQAVAWAKSGSGYEAGWLKDLDTGATPDAANLLQSATAAPQGSKLWGSYTAYMAKGQPYLDGTPIAFDIRISGDDSDDRLVAKGCVPTGLEMTFTLNEPAKMTITWGVGTWSEEGSGGAPSLQAWDFPAPEAVKGGCVVWGSDAASTRVINSLTFNLGLTRNALMSYCEEDTVAGFYTVDVRPRVTFNVLRDVSLEPTEFAAGTTRAFTATFGSQPGKIFSLCIPQAVIQTFPGFQDGDGAMYAPVELSTDQTYTGDTGSAPAGTFCRFAWI